MKPQKPHREPKQPVQFRMKPSVGLPDPAALLPLIKEHLRKKLAEAQNSSSALTDPQRSMRILRLPDVMDRVGLRKTQIYGLMASGKFPKALKLSQRATGWLEHEIDAFIQARAMAR